MKTEIGKLAIIGVGLIGGSFGLICREKGIAKEVWGFSRRESNLLKARERGLIDNYSLDIKEVVENADVVMLATPVEGIINIAAKVAPFLAGSAIVTDCGSAKDKIVKKLEKILPPGVRFVGGHPIAGTEMSGPEAAFATLFQNRHCILTPTPDTDGQAVDLVKYLWEQTGAIVSLMEPEKHDELLATISHLPHMAAFALLNSIAKKEHDFPGLFSFSAGGLKDITRIASSSPVMWREICQQNGQAIIQAIEDFRNVLAEIADHISNGNGEKIERIFQNSKKIRERL